MLFGKNPCLAPIKIPDTATEVTPNPNRNNNLKDLINIKIHERNDLINIMSSSMLFDKDACLANIKIPDTATEETLNPKPKSNPNPNPNDLINIKSHKLNDLLNIMSSSMLFLNDPRLAPIRIRHTATEETPNPNINPNPTLTPMTS